MSIAVPQNKIVAIPHHDQIFFPYTDQYQSLRGQLKRDWFINHAYLCLPLTIGNQYGFIVKSLHTFDIIWNGGDRKEDTIVVPKDSHGDRGQFISSHFGVGIVTVQNSFILRTPEGVNLMTINPPNYFIDGIHFMSGVIETDNLRRDFTFNLKVTRPNYKISVKAGDWIGCFIPIPRYFVDSFDMISASDNLTPEQIEIEQQCSNDFGRERDNEDKTKLHLAGRRYFKGQDVYGNVFQDHQKHVKS